MAWARSTRGSTATGASGSSARRCLFVGSAPLDGVGHVNVSPKGPIGSLRVIGPSTPSPTSTWWAAAPETIAHRARERPHRRHALRLRRPAAHPALARPRRGGHARRLRLRRARPRNLTSKPGAPESRRAIVSGPRGPASPTRAATACRSWSTRATASTRTRGRLVRSGGPTGLGRPEGGSTERRENNTEASRRPPRAGRPSEGARALARWRRRTRGGAADAARLRQGAQSAILGTSGSARRPCSPAPSGRCRPCA